MFKNESISDVQNFNYLRASIKGAVFEMALLSEEGYKGLRSLTHTLIRNEIFLKAWNLTWDQRDAKYDPATWGNLET